MKYKIYLAVLFSLIPLYSHSAQLTFSPRASAEVEFTDNLFLSNEDEQEDTITTVSAGFAAGVAGKQAGLTLAYDPSYAFYQEFTENDGWRHNASGRFFWELTRHTRLEVSDTFLLTEDPLSESEITALRAADELADFDPTVRKGRNEYWRNTAYARLSHQFGKKDSVYADVKYGILENDDPTIQDSRYITPTAGLTVWFGPRWGVDLSGNYTESDFDQADPLTQSPSSDFERYGGAARLMHQFTRHLNGYLRYQYSRTVFDEDERIPAGLLEDDYQVHDAAVGIEYAIEEDILLDVRGGYFYRDNESGAQSDDDEGFSGSLTLTKLLRRGKVELAGAAGWDESYFGSQNLGFNNYADGGVNFEYRVLRRLSVDAYGGYRYSKYVDQSPQREDDIFRAGGGLTWEPLLWLSIRGGYSFREVQSNVGTEEYQENRGLITVNLAPDQPFRF